MRVIIDYTNHRGERNERRISPITLGFSSPHHPAEFVILAFDLDKKEERTFALKNIHSWREEL